MFRRSGKCYLLIVIAFYHGAIQFADKIQAFSRVGVITDHVSQTNKVRPSAVACIRENCFERFKISMDITQNCEAHGRKIKPPKAQNVTALQCDDNRLLAKILTSTPNQSAVRRVNYLAVLF